MSAINENEIESNPAPEWLSKLESRREHFRAKLGHEIGAGAPCNNCTDCSGLDLHFWRKMCRNCKCHRDQHDCSEDEFYERAQFEILGQKRPQKLVQNVKIKAFSEPVKLDWIPPNTDSELAAEYMSQIGKENIPVSGSKASVKRRERLRFQVPLHDLDASMCDNLSENEATQLGKYVKRIKDNCVGQGEVVRLNNLHHGTIHYANDNTSKAKSNANLSSKNFAELIKTVRNDQILMEILQSEPIHRAIYHPESIKFYSKLILLRAQPRVERIDSIYQLNSSDKQQLNEIGIDAHALHSAVINGHIYDKLFEHLDTLKIDYNECERLRPIREFRKKFIASESKNDLFANNVKAAVAWLEKSKPISFISNTSTLNANVQSTSSFDPFNLVALVEALEPNDNVAYVGGAAATESTKALTKCRGCLMDIIIGTVAVKADRCGADAAWHPQCFTCHKCNDILADLVYFHHKGNIYCGRDLATILNIPRCNGCDELIFTKNYTAAEGCTFHIKHFCCLQCDTPLAGQDYIPDSKTNLPLCLNCYDQFYAQQCKTCCQNIGPTEESVNFERLHWHKRCFYCGNFQCKKTLIGQKFTIKNDSLYCSSNCMTNQRAT